MKQKLHLVMAVLTAAAGVSAGCQRGGAASSPNSAAATTTAAAFKPCGPDGVIDDGEDNNNQTHAVAGRGGYWYSFLDTIGSTVTPQAGTLGGTFTMSPGGAGGTKFAASIKGKIGKADQPPAYLYAGLGFNFLDPKGIYDASKYAGVSFWAKKGPGSTGKVRLKVPDSNTDPDGKKCTACFNDFGTDLNLTETWTKYTVPFSEMRQIPGWGSPNPDAVTPAKLYGLQWQINQPNAAYEVWVDEVQFICK